MGHRRSYPNGNPDLRRRCQVPAPEIEEIEQLFFKSLTPAAFKTLKGQQDTHGQLMRYRLLTLPVMVAVVLTLVNRRVNS
jgi:hypothetical protein